MPIPLLLQISAVAWNQILGGTTVNRGVRTKGAQLHKSQNIGWARARVPTIRIRPCVVINKYYETGNRIYFRSPIS